LALGDVWGARKLAKPLGKFGDVEGMAVFSKGR